MAEPRATKSQFLSKGKREKGEGDFLERQHFSHASINLIEYLRYNLSFVSAPSGISSR